MKIELINISVHKAIASSIKRRPKSANYPSLGLITLAAMIPGDIEISFVDDNIKEINFNDGQDLVGLSFLTPAAYRAYEIADIFRNRNVTVVMGGVHVSAMPEEAAEHADAIVIGEAEETWPQLLADFRDKNLKKVYKANNYVDLSTIPIARRDLLDKKHYITKNVIQASRGCPLNCEFCSVGDLFGRKIRFRPVKNVIEEIKTMDNQVVLFTDDNLAINKAYAEKLFTSLIPLKRDWVGETSYTIANDPELLRLARKSGCRGLLIGFESICEQKNVQKVSRYRDMKSVYMKAIDKIHKSGIAIVGAFIFGFDNDDESIFNETLNFAMESDIEILELNTLIPYPGTPLYSRLKKENRIFEDDWRKYTYYPPGICFHSKQMYPETILSNLGRIYRKFYSFKLIIPRLKNAWKRFKNLKMVVFLLVISLGNRRRIRKGY